jgi:hypothetical protein
LLASILPLYPEGYGSIEYKYDDISLIQFVIPGLTRNPLPTGRQECFSGFPLSRE